MKDRRQHFAHGTNARVFTGQNDLEAIFPALLGLAKPAFLQTFDVIVDLINFRRIAERIIKRIGPSVFENSA